METLSHPSLSKRGRTTPVQIETAVPLQSFASEASAPLRTSPNSTPPQTSAASKPDLRLVLGLTLYALVGSAVTLAGWFGRTPRLTDWFDTGISMFPNTAVAAMLASGSALLALTVARWRKPASRALALLVALIGAASLLEHLLGVDLGVDAMLINPQWGHRAATSPGRMGPPASISFFLLGSGFWLLHARSSARRLVSFLGTATIGISALGMVGYLFQADPLFSHARITGIAFQTATIIFALAVALLASAPDLQPFRTLRQNTAAGGLVRRALPFTILLPITLCGLFILGRNALWFDRGMGTAILALALSAVLCGLLWWCAKDVARHEATSSATQARLHSLLSLMPAAIYACDQEGRITFYNSRAAELWGRKPKLNDSQERFCAVHKCWLGETLIKPEQTPMALAVREGKSFRGLEAVFERPDGVSFPVLVNIDPLLDSDGKPAGAVNVFQDITELKQAEVALRESEQRLRATFNQAAVGIAIADGEGALLETNQKFCDIVGYSCAELLSFPITKLTHPDDLQQTRQNMQRVLSSDIAHYAYEKRFIRKDGNPVWVLATVAGIKDAKGRPCFIGIVEDIDQRKKTEQTLQTKQRELEIELADSKLLSEISATLIREENVGDLYEKILDGAVAIMRSDMASMQMVDEQEDALRMLASRGFAPSFGEIFKLNRRDTRTSCCLARKTGQRVVMADIEACDFVAGSPPTLEGHRQTGIRAVQSTPLISRGGKLVGIISTHWGRPHEPCERDLRLLDILARQAADLLERRQTSKGLATLAAVVENSDDAIITKDLEGTITSWNKSAERIFGYTAQEIIGKPVAVLIPSDRQNEEPAILARLRAGQRVDHFETIRRRKDGTLLDISLTVSPLRDSEGRIIGASKIARDITELRKARETLASSHRELEKRVAERTASLTEVIAQMEEFSYSVSHDLRAPIRAMQGYANAALEEYGSTLDSRGRDYIQRIIRSGARMDRLVRELLTYSRLARSDIALQPVPLDMLVRDIISQYPEMQSPRAEIFLEGTLPTVLAHEPSLTQAISNLLSNAVKFVAPGVSPVVKVYSERRADRLRLWFHDNGIGIKPEHQERLFGLFQRIHPNEKYEGTGIGLAVVRKSVERMGGKVGMESNGSGSKFWIELPAADAQGEPS